VLPDATLNRALSPALRKLFSLILADESELTEALSNQVKNKFPLKKTFKLGSPKN
jgi:hypothetical protein